MKANRILLAALTAVLATATLNAATPGSGQKAGKLAQAERNYAACLASENHGVVESGLAQIAQMKLRYPDAEFARLTKEVGRLVAEGNTPAIRYKAAIVAAVLDNPALFDAEAANATQNAEMLLSAIASRLQSEFVTYADR